jgi:hypothetical protein
MWDRFRVPKGVVQLRFRFVSTDSEWKQGMSLTADGQFLINNVIVKKAAVLWEDTAPSGSEFECETRNGIVEVTNVRDTGDGVAESWHGGAAMMVEAIKEGRRYRCNDGHFDDDFDDLVFELELISK